MSRRLNQISAAANSQQCHVDRTLLMFLLLAAAVAVSAIVLFQHYPVGRQPDTELIIEQLRGNVLPEPAESFIFAVLAAATPLAAIVLAIFGQGLGAARVMVVFPAAIAAGFYGLFCTPDLLGQILGNFASPSPGTGIAVVIALVFAWLACFWMPPRLPGRHAVLAVLVALAVLQLLAWRVLTSNFNDNDMVWTSHADPVFYAIAQVLGGKTILADLPSQYGLYPELLAPLFRLADMTTGRLGAAFAILQIVAMSAVLLATSRVIRSPVILGLTGMALVMVTFQTVMHFSHYRELYFQYWPLRFFWPALTTLCFLRYREKPTAWWAALVSLVSGLGIVWNADTGIVVAVAFGAFLAAKIFFVANRRAYVIALGSHFAIVAFILASMAALLYVKGGALHVYWIVEYQRIFLKLGLMMLPLPLQPHAWMAVVSLYILAMVVACNQWRVKASVRADILFFLAVMGLGLFSYYAGRSHILNLITVLWPAVLIVGMLVDSTFLLIRRGALGARYFPLCVVGLAALMLTAGSLAWRIPLLAKEAVAHAKLRATVTPSIAQAEVAFIRAHAGEGSPCVIAAKRQGIYHLETSTFSPVPGPGLSELLLAKDQKQFVDTLLAGGQSCLFFGLGTSSAGLPLTLEELKRKYIVSGQLTTGTMIFLQPR